MINDLIQTVNLIVTRIEFLSGSDKQPSSFDVAHIFKLGWNFRTVIVSKEEVEFLHVGFPDCPVFIIDHNRDIN